jgi:outer membrane protein OmpA-like peptidoglycan-associated protein
MRAQAWMGGMLAVSLVLAAVAAEPVADTLRADPRSAEFFAAVLAARDAAQKADAFLYAPSPWQRAEDELARAANAYAGGATDDASARGAEASALYVEAEKAAFATSVLAEPRAAIAQARKARAGRLAPQTFARAEALLVQANEALAGAPGERDRARELAREATVEAKRAVAVSEGLADTATAEQTVLAWQRAFDEVARGAGVTLPADASQAQASAAVVAAIEAAAAERARLEEALAERNEQIRSLQGESTSLASQLDSVARERVELARRLEDEAAQRERFTALGNLFEPGVAEVLREREDIVIRLPGLRFPPGSSKLGKDQQKLLDELIQGVGLYADRDVIVEGHTDASGSDDANLELSRARARSVREYLIASGRVPAARVTSEGYGETRPVASNDTDEGRARNRRIDVRLVGPDRL